MISFLRTVFFYLLLVIVLRVMGKRQIGEMEPSEFVVTMMAANLSTAPIENPGSPIIYGLIAILTILGAELVLSTVTMCSVSARRLFCGKPVILIENGKLLQENLRKTRITLDELTCQLREKDVLDLTTVRYAILETNGAMSVFLYAKDRPASAGEAGIQAEETCLPVTIIEDGRVLKENLQKAGKDENWLKGVLRDRSAGRNETLLLTVDEKNTIFFIRKEKKM